MNWVSQLLFQINWEAEKKSEHKTVLNLPMMSVIWKWSLESVWCLSLGEMEVLFSISGSVDILVSVVFL